MLRLQELMAAASASHSSGHFADAEYLLQDAIYRASVIAPEDWILVSRLYERIAAVLEAKGECGRTFQILAEFASRKGSGDRDQRPLLPLVETRKISDTAS
jgi:hypothetical protein